MSDIHVRQAREDDISDLVGAYEWLFAFPGAQPPTWDARRAAETLSWLRAAQDAAVLVAMDPDEVLVGFATVYRDIRSVRFGQRAWVEDLAVDPQRRSAGIGRKLLDAARHWASQHGATHLELDTGLARDDAQRFYQREQPSWSTLCYGWLLP